MVRWWSRHNYVLAAALDVGTIVGVLVIFICLQLPRDGKLQLDWFGNTIFTNSLSRSSVPCLLKTANFSFFFYSQLPTSKAVHFTRRQRRASDPRPYVFASSLQLFAGSRSTFVDGFAFRYSGQSDDVGLLCLTGFLSLLLHVFFPCFFSHSTQHLASRLGPFCGSLMCSAILKSIRQSPPSRLLLAHCSALVTATRPPRTSAGSARSSPPSSPKTLSADPSASPKTTAGQGGSRNGGRARGF
jgi:hypothetical protein